NHRGPSMTHILIVESSSPPVAELRRSHHRSAPQNFTRVFQSVDPDVRVTTREPYINPLRPSDLDGVDGVVLTGQGDPWAADDLKAEPIRQACQIVFDHTKPSIGVCFGLQIATVVLGGKIMASPNGFETGIAKQIHLTDDGKRHPMMQHRQCGFSVACGHRDEVSEMPKGAVLLASNNHTQVQAMSYTNGPIDFWGIQYHPEVAPSTIAAAFREGKSMFSSSAPPLEDLARVEHDAQAAARLGCSVDDFVLSTRTRELTNWLAYVQREVG
ncbi:type 1 glutamine amidotransferase, partial [Tateyamaria sp.]|uniref:type 1 glutamine amidotransferase n=2 Tax=Alphaproteobacteria TaxID=28211 RepID=UPI00329C327A